MVAFNYKFLAKDEFNSIINIKVNNLNAKFAFEKLIFVLVHDNFKVNKHFKTKAKLVMHLNHKYLIV